MVPITRIFGLVMYEAKKQKNPQRRRSLLGMLQSESAAAKLSAAEHLLADMPVGKVVANSAGELFAAIEDTELRQKAENLQVEVQTSACV